MVAHKIKILKHRIGRTTIPVGIVIVFKGRQNGNSPISPQHHVPGGPCANVIYERIRAVLT